MDGNDDDVDSCLDINSANFNSDLYLKETFKVCFTSSFIYSKKTLL